MKETYNWKSLFAGMGVILFGIGLCIASAFIPAITWVNITLGIGCSLIASGLVILMHDFFIERKMISPLDEWKMEKIYSTRSERNVEADPVIDEANYCIDGIIFGISTFRNMHGKKIEKCLKKGVQIRLLTMDPNGEFIAFREKEEDAAPDGIKSTIKDMIQWANVLNEKNYKGKIVVKGYKSMTLDYYWRVDNELYVGPYWYGYKSSDTITYKFSSKGRGFKHYSEYFEKLWDDTDLSVVLTKIDSNPKLKRKK